MKEIPFEKGRRPVQRTVKLRAPAKVNLHLEVLRQRHDGYHEIETVFQAVRIFDQVSVTLLEQWQGGEPDIQITVTPVGAAPADPTNLCWQAARHFCRELKVSGQLSIDLTKDIPAASGLGGGSSDAAAVLVACDRLFKTGLDPSELERLARPLGADVPFFVQGGAALGRGIGDILSRMPSAPTGQFLIVKPELDLKTHEVYANVKMGLTVNSSKANISVMKPMLSRFPQETWPGFNRLEDAVLPQHPALQRIVHSLRDVAPIAMLSGSGSAVVAVFEDGHPLEELVEEFQSAGLFVRVVGPHGKGVEILKD